MLPRVWCLDQVRTPPHNLFAPVSVDSIGGDAKQRRSSSMEEASQSSSQVSRDRNHSMKQDDRAAGHGGVNDTDSDSESFESEPFADELVYFHVDSSRYNQEVASLQVKLLSGEEETPGSAGEQQSHKAMRVLGIQSEALQRSKALRVMGVTEDDFQTSRDVFSRFRRFATQKSGMAGSAAPKAMQMLGVDPVGLRLHKPMRVLGLDERDLDREKAQLLARLGYAGFAAEDCLSTYESMQQRRPPSTFCCAPLCF